MNCEIYSVTAMLKKSFHNKKETTIISVTLELDDVRITFELSGPTLYAYAAEDPELDIQVTINSEADYPRALEFLQQAMGETLGGFTTHQLLMFWRLVRAFHQPFTQRLRPLFPSLSPVGSTSIRYGARLVNPRVIITQGMASSAFVPDGMIVHPDDMALTRRWWSVSDSPGEKVHVPETFMTQDIPALAHQLVSFIDALRTLGWKMY